MFTKQRRSSIIIVYLVVSYIVIKQVVTSYRQYEL